jgi:hypothetical protein
MIDIKFIESAREIRKKYITLHDQLDESKKDVTQLASFLDEKLKELAYLNENVVKTAKDKDELISVTKTLISKLDEIENRERIMTKRIDDINEDIEKLKLEEIDLMKKIKNKYPDLSNQEIIKEVHQRLWS